MNNILTLLIVSFVVTQDVHAQDGCPPCPDEDSPVCADDGYNVKSFPNFCEIGLYNCQQGTSFTYNYKGKCCSDICDGRDCEEPICATSSDSAEKETSFACECKMEIINCRFNTVYKKLHDGLCVEESVDGSGSGDSSSEEEGSYSFENEDLTP